MKCKRDNISVPLKSDKVCIYIYIFCFNQTKICQRQKSNKKMAQNISTCFLISKTIDRKYYNMFKIL